jgi:RNA polymerase sigma-70 factor, ECF subfamily
MRPELAQAIELLRGNSQANTEKAISLLQNTVYAFSMKVCGHPEDAEDTMQEVLYRSLRHLAQIQEPRALAVWLYTVARNRCWRMRRKNVHAPKHLLSLDELMPDDAELAYLLKDATPGPETKLLQSEQNQQLQQAILHLPAQLRIVLVLHDMEELDTEDVAQVLGLKSGTVRVRLHRARLSLRKEMSRQSTANSTKSGEKLPNKPQRSRLKTPKRPTECRELFANLSEYLDDRLEPVTCEQMSKHIEDCPSCVAFLHNIRTAIDRCHAMQLPCKPAVTARLRVLLLREYLRMMGKPSEK